MHNPRRVVIVQSHIPLISANQLVISEDTTWSGEITLDKDVVISPGPHY